MSLDGTYDDGNLFARLIRGEVPSAKVFEDAETLAFMDVFPQSPGHCLVVHKADRARNLLDADANALCAVMRTTQRVARAVRAALDPEGIMISQFNGAPAGQTIFHLHVHIIPRWESRPLGRHGAGGMADLEDLRATAATIAAALA